MTSSEAAKRAVKNYRKRRQEKKVAISFYLDDDLEAEIFERLDLEQSKKHTIIKALRIMYDL